MRQILRFINRRRLIVTSDSVVAYKHNLDKIVILLKEKFPEWIEVSYYSALRPGTYNFYIKNTITDKTTSLTIALNERINISDKGRLFIYYVDYSSMSLVARIDVYIKNLPILKIEF